MKTVFTTQEGVKMNSNLDFGGTTDIENEFQYFMTTYETIFEEEFDFYYRITDDNYIQLANSYEGSELNIVAQYQLKHKNFKENIKHIVIQNIEAHYLYDGLPSLKNSTVFTQVEFDEVINGIIDKKKNFQETALKNETELIAFLRKNKLNPKPSGNNSNSWIAKCPSEGNHFIQVVTTKDEWGCGYCNKKGTITEMKKWLWEIAIKKDQKNLSKMMQELKNGGIQTKETLSWWMNRY